MQFKLSLQIHCVILAPGQPRLVQARANSSSEIVISWLPPLKLNGVLQGYYVTGSIEPDQLPDRDFCYERKETYKLII